MAVRASPVEEEEKVVHQDIATLRPMEWINDNIVNFVGKVVIQPWRGRGAAKVHVSSSHLMDRLLRAADPTTHYDFAAVGGWRDKVPGGISSLDEIFIPVNPDGNHGNFIHVRVQEKMIELWDSLGPQASNAKYLAAAEKFVKDALAREELAGRISAERSRHIGWENVDRSGDLPRQGNGYDCGIFMLTSMSHVRNGLQLSREAYTQGILTLQRARKRLAERIHMGNGGQQ